ncbi:MAG: YceI family protein [Nocardioidaceae bacterium]|nr:YceI family protein [Nocardioidaceae bacterium]
MSNTLTTIPGLEAGTWAIDPAHSEISFTVRHLMSKVRGVFRDFEGTAVVAADALASTASATIQLASVDTGTKQRDDHLRSSDFFNVDTQPVMTFVSTEPRSVDDGRFVLAGDLTVNGITRSVELALEVLGVEVNGYGQTIAGFEATGEINRKDFGIDFNMPLDSGRLMIGDKVTVALMVQAAKQA